LPIDGANRLIAADGFEGRPCIPVGIRTLRVPQGNGRAIENRV